MNNPYILSLLGISEYEFQKTVLHLDKYVAIALDRISSCPFNLNSIYVGHSGGKDSVVVQWLADKVSVFPTVHTPKSTGPNAVHPLTREFLYKQDRAIHYVPAHMHNLFNYNTQIDGTRRDEGSRDDGRSTTFVNNGVDVKRNYLSPYVKNGLFGLNFIYPIYDWTDLDVWSLIVSRNIPFSDEYLL